MIHSSILVNVSSLGFNFHMYIIKKDTYHNYIRIYNMTNNYKVFNIFKIFKFKKSLYTHQMNWNRRRKNLKHYWDTVYSNIQSNWTDILLLKHDITTLIKCQYLLKHNIYISYISNKIYNRFPKKACSKCLYNHYL